MSQNVIFVFLLFRNPHTKGTKAPVSLANIEMWLQRCNDIAEYIFALKDEKGNIGIPTIQKIKCQVDSVDEWA